MLMGKHCSVRPVVFLLSLAAAVTTVVDSSRKHQHLHQTSRNDLFNIHKQQREKNQQDDNLSEWLDKTNEEMREQKNALNEAMYHYETNLTDENSALLEKQSSVYDDWYSDVYRKAQEYLDPDITDEEQLWMLALLLEPLIPPADNPQINQNITTLVNKMSSIYANAEYNDGDQVYRLDPEFTDIMANSRNYSELLWAWDTWRRIAGVPVQNLYDQLVNYMNQAAKDNGYSDISSCWNLADYHMTDIESIIENLFLEVEPLYNELRKYVFRKLKEFYPQMKSGKYLEAHLLGNMWAQSWNNIYDLVAPYPDVLPESDTTEVMKEQQYTPQKMFSLAEDFFVSLGLEKMTPIFWNKSMIVRPKDRQVICHASASDLFSPGDYRIKMCTSVTFEDLETVHHEMGHIEYFMEYSKQPTVFRDGANAAFHEAIGDTITLSMQTTNHLRTIGLLEEDYDDDDDDDEGITYKRNINFLMQLALIKLPLIPWTYMLDKWRYETFRRDISPEEYNKRWWELSENYRGITHAVELKPIDFDPGAKYHIIANVPYYRYFLSTISQFQFHESLCSTAGFEGELFNCDIYGSKKAGKSLKDALQLGCSQKWPDVMELLTGQRKYSADSINKYFEPLSRWLKKRNNHHGTPTRQHNYK